MDWSSDGCSSDLFKPSKEGGWEGNLRTLGINERLRLVPNDDRSSDDAAAFRVMLGRQRIGDAWEACTQDGKERDYLRLRLDDPGFARPMTDRKSTRLNSSH